MDLFAERRHPSCWVVHFDVTQRGGTGAHPLPELLRKLVEPDRFEKLQATERERQVEPAGGRQGTASAARSRSLEALVETRDVVASVDLSQGDAQEALGRFLGRELQEDESLMVLVEAGDIALDLMQLEWSLCVA
jgi:hypothetical protein